MMNYRNNSTVKKMSLLIGILLLAVNAQAQIVIQPRPISAGGSFSNPLLAPDGSASAPSYSFASDTDLGFWRSGTNAIQLSADDSFYLTRPSGAQYLRFSWNNTAAGEMSFGRNGTFSSTLTTDANDVLALKDGTTAQTFRIYNTTTGSEYAKLTWNDSTNVFDIGTVGGARPIRFKVNNTAIWSFDASGNLIDQGTHSITAAGVVATGDGTSALPGFAFGSQPALGIYRVASDDMCLTFSGGCLHRFSGNSYILQSSAGYLGWSDAVIKRPAAGVIQLGNASTITSFTRLILGTNDATTNGLSLKLNGNQLQIRLGDDSGNASLFADELASVSQFRGTAATGTLITNTAQSIADNGVISLLSGAAGVYTVYWDGQDGVCEFVVRGATNTVNETVDPSGLCSTTSGTANSVNVYYSSGYKLENKTTATRNFYLVLRK